MKDTSDFLRPCLVLGTGFHRSVLGESMQTGFEPLLDWHALLLAVAREMRVPFDRTPIRGKGQASGSGIAASQ